MNAADSQQLTVDLIEGRMCPDDYAALLDADPTLTDWLQSCIPEGETWDCAVSTTFDELIRAELSGEQYAQTAAAIAALRGAPEEQQLTALSALLPLLHEAGRVIPVCTTLVFHLAGTYAAMLDGTIPCTEKQRAALPGMLLDALDQPFDRAEAIPYNVRTVWESLRAEERPGTLSFRLNLHGWITGLIQQHRPDLSVTPDPSLGALHDLLSAACPECVDGPEVWACGILERLAASLPEGMKRSERTKLLKERICEAFHLAPKAKRPRWMQSPDWPIHEGRPMRFLRTEKQHGGEVLLHRFVDDATGTERIVQDGT